ncbi:hypothetical protein [Streptomyces sp. KAU_LT]|uniref:hypothetical protein n=1 Tax=Streptomyces sp. KAU_LT TaxID=3046669 RepID=UPI0032D5A08C
MSWVMGFFHQDWTLDADSAADVVAGLLAGSVDEEAVAVRRDAQVLCSLPSSTLEVLWDAGAEYIPAWSFLGGGAEWTRTVVALCDARLAASADVHPLSGADTEDGLTCLDAVVAEIEDARFLEGEVRTALTDCARRCTPDLAFRMLLSAIRTAPDVSLSAERYARLEVIGSALQYGEFLVDCVSHLVEQQN